MLTVTTRKFHYKIQFKSISASQNLKASIANMHKHLTLTFAVTVLHGWLQSKPPLDQLT